MFLTPVVIISHFLMLPKNLTSSATCCPAAFLSICNLLEKQKRLLRLHFLWHISGYFANDFFLIYMFIIFWVTLGISLLCNPNIKEDLRPVLFREHWFDLWCRCWNRSVKLYKWCGNKKVTGGFIGTLKAGLWWSNTAHTPFFTLLRDLRPNSFEIKSS